MIVGLRPLEDLDDRGFAAQKVFERIGPTLTREPAVGLQKRPPFKTAAVDTKDRSDRLSL